MPKPFFPFLILLAACGAPPPLPGIAPGPSTILPPAAPASMADDEVVAFLNGRPVTRREVADRAFAADGRNLIDQFIRWKVRGDRVRELGISNTDEELKARGRAILVNFRESRGEEDYLRELADAGLTEEQYIARFASTAEFSDRLAIEKAFAYDLVVEGSVLFDGMAFETEEEGRRFLALIDAGATFDDAAAVTLQRKARAARWPRYRVSRELTVEALAKSDWIARSLFELKAGALSALEQTAGGYWLVLRCVAADPPAPGTYAQHRDRAASEAVLGRATDEQLRTWLDRLLKACRIEYKDSMLPRK